MRELVEYLAKALASRPDEVTIEEEQRGDQIVFHLQCADEDKGRIIGCSGSASRFAQVDKHLAHRGFFRSNPQIGFGTHDFTNLF